jgi:hypothetical protein
MLLNTADPERRTTGPMAVPLLLAVDLYSKLLPSSETRIAPTVC